MRALFWVSCAVLAYSYLGYPLLVWILARLFGHEPAKQEMLPLVSLLIPAYNEEAELARKLQNSVSLDYPADRLEIVVASDGSTDDTEAIARAWAPRVRLIAMSSHIGKAAMLRRVTPALPGEIVVFSDVSSELEPDALRALVRNFSDDRVGCVSGLYRLKASDDLRGQGEGLYWRYETWIKRQESRLHSILGAHGAFYAIRRSLFPQLNDATINDDYLIPMRIVEQGYRAIYEPGARAWEREVASIHGEFARRRRIAVGNCQQIKELASLLNPVRGWVAFCFVSHKVLRTFAPVAMLLAFLSSFWLPWPWSSAVLTLQTIFYAGAWAGYLCQRRGVTISWLSPPLYFCLGNLAMLAGLLRYCVGRQSAVWERAK